MSEQYATYFAKKIPNTSKCAYVPWRPFILIRRKRSNSEFSESARTLVNPCPKWSLHRFALGEGWQIHWQCIQRRLVAVFFVQLGDNHDFQVNDIDRRQRQVHDLTTLFDYKGSWDRRKVVIIRNQRIDEEANASASI